MDEDNIKCLIETHIEIRRVAFDTDFHMLRLNFAAKLLGRDIDRKLYIDVYLFQSLIPLKDLLI